MLVDCESAAGLSSHPVSSSEFIKNTNGGGKLHRVLEKDPTQHPRTWRTRCGWRFGRESTEHEWFDTQQAMEHPSKFKCSKCFPEIRHGP